MGNDFDESSCLIIQNLATIVLMKRNNILVPYEKISFIKKFARWSAFARYIVLNAHIDPRNLFTKQSDYPKFIANTSSDFSEERINLSKGAVDLFIADSALSLSLKCISFWTQIDRISTQRSAEALMKIILKS